jgi:hypothetical protein
VLALVVARMVGVGSHDRTDGPGGSRREAMVVLRYRHGVETAPPDLSTGRIRTPTSERSTVDEATLGGLLIHPRSARRAR